MEQLITLLSTANSLTPLGIIALLVIAVILLIRQAKVPKNVASQESVNLLATNHLHSLPEIAETLKRIETKLELLGEIKDDTSYLKGRINGKS